MVLGPRNFEVATFFHAEEETHLEIATFRNRSFVPTATVQCTLYM